MRGIDWKRGEVETVAELTKTNPVIGVASIHEIPAKQFQAIRRDLRGKVRIRVSKKTLVSQALPKSGRERIGEIESNMSGEVALLFTEMNPFRLFRYLEDGKVSAPAKPGHKPPADVWVQKGETSFPPGPIVSQLQKVGIPARIERGKVVILEDTLFVKAGETIDRARSDILSQLGIEPMRIGLDVAAIYEDGMVFDRSVLDVDAEEISSQVSLGVRQAFNLSLNSGFPTDLTIVPLLQDAYRRARSLSVTAAIVTSGTIGDLLASAQGGAIALASTMANRDPDSVGEELREYLGRKAPAKEHHDDSAEKGKEKEATEAPDEEEKEEESVGLGALFG